MQDDQLTAVISDVLSPGRFFLPPPGELYIDHVPEETLAWEIYCGHLLDESRTRNRKTFEAWTVECQKPRAEGRERSGGESQGSACGYPEADASGSLNPQLSNFKALFSIRHDAEEQCLHVTRSILMAVTEAYEQSPGVIGTRDVQKWMPELVGTVDLGRIDGETLGRELATYLFQAVVGTSRLPITSLESPLPAFTLGRLAYIPVDTEAKEPCRDPRQLLEIALTAAALNEVQRAKLLEAALRAIPAGQVAALAERLAIWGEEPDTQVPLLLQTLFNHVGLSPYTDFVAKFVALLRELARPAKLGAEPIIDVFGSLLRQIGRHLTAFDLVTFHNRGANYPDALTLDALWQAALELAEANGDGFLRSGSMTEEQAAVGSGERPQPVSRTKRLRRRAVRQGWILRRHYEGLPVPDLPTSPGENARILPEPFQRISPEQITDPRHRSRQLYVGEPTHQLLSQAGEAILADSFADLEQDSELYELGTALFLDRPLGVFKQPAEVDRTPLLSYLAFSRQIARRRLDELAEANRLSPQRRDELRGQLEQLEVAGISAREYTRPERPGVVSLEQARSAAEDFVFQRTTRHSLRDFLESFDFSPLGDVAPAVFDWLHSREPVLLIRPGDDLSGDSTDALLVAYDRWMRPRLELGPAGEPIQYRVFTGVEVLQQGLQVLSVGWPNAAEEHFETRDLRRQQITLPPRSVR